MIAATGLKRLGLAVAAVIAAGFGGLLIVSLVIPAATVREAVKAEIRAVTGLDPVLRGAVSVSLFPTGTVSFTDVALGEDQAGAPALTAERMVVRLRFIPFLGGNIKIADVSLVRPVININFEPDGTANWSNQIGALAHALEPTAGRVGSFSEIRIEDGTVVLRDETHDLTETLDHVEFALAWPSISKSFAATGRFTWRDEPLDASLTLNDFLAALSGDRSGLKVRIAGAPLKFAFDGNLSYRPRLRMEGTLAADARSLRDLLRWSSGETPPGTGFGRFALKAQTNVNGGNVALTGVNLELDGNVGEGVLTLNTDGRRTVQGTLAAEGLDLTPYISTFRLLTSGGDRHWNRVPIVLDGLNGLDVDLRLSAARVTLGSAKLGRTAAAASLSGGNLILTVGESQAFGGMLKGYFGLATSAAGADLKMQLQFADVDLDQCLGELFAFRRIEGKGTLAFAIESSGGSVYDLTTSLNGTATLTGRKGAIVGLNVEQLLKRLERNPLSGRGELRNGKTPYDLLSVSVKATDGVASVEDVRIEGPLVRLGLNGSASIPTRDLDLKGTASLLASGTVDTPPVFELPFVVQGPWDDPLMLPDAQSLIKRSGAAAPLLDLLRKR